MRFRRRQAASLKPCCFRGQLPRGEVADVLGLSDRQARRVVAALIRTPSARVQRAHARLSTSRSQRSSRPVGCQVSFRRRQPEPAPRQSFPFCLGAIAVYAAVTASIGTPNSTGQRCAYRAPATMVKAGSFEPDLSPLGSP